MLVPSAVAQIPHNVVVVACVASLAATDIAVLVARPACSTAAAVASRSHPIVIVVRAAATVAAVVSAGVSVPAQEIQPLVAKLSSRHSSGCHPSCLSSVAAC